MSSPEANVRGLQELVRLTPIDERAEKSVREMVRRCADNCPVEVLAQLGQCLVDARRSELRNEAGSN